MGATASKQSVTTVNKNLSETLSTTTQTIAQTSSAQSGTSQNFTIKDLSACGGDINISNIQQETIALYNFSQMATSTSESDYQTAIKNSLNSLAESDTTVKNELGGVGITTDEQYNLAVQDSISRIATVVNQAALSNISANMTNSQDLSFLDFSTVCGPGTFNSGGNININNITQSIQLDFVSEQVAILATQEYSKIVAENALAVQSGQKLYVQNTGFASLVSAWFSGITGIIVTIIIVLALLIAIIVVPIVVLKRKAKKKAAALLGAPGAAKASVATTGPEEAAALLGAPGAAKASVATTGPEEAVIKEGMGSTQQQAAPQTGGGMGSSLQRFASSPQAKQLFNKGLSYLGK